MPANYDFQNVEKKWQKQWEETGVFHAKQDFTLPKYFCLVEFPYPSGQGLHVGHPRSYTALDIIARKKRLEGYNVLYPMGWDAFGLPAENYAIKNHVHPAEVTKKNIQEMRKHMQMVFQDPYSSLNPRMTVEDIIAEPLVVQKVFSSHKERREKVLELMETVGLNAEHATRYAHEFSGGQRQRIGIARALALNPDFIVCDEPVSALDVSIQAQVINMFEDLQKELGMAYLFIAHDLLVVRHISNRIAVMYLGKIVEIGDADEVYEHPVHPYTQSLLSAVPIPDPRITREKKRIVLEGDVPSPLHMPSGCPFRTRCRYATEQCSAECPSLTDRGSGHMAACWNA